VASASRQGLELASTPTVATSGNMNLAHVGALRPRKSLFRIPDPALMLTGGRLGRARERANCPEPNGVGTCAPREKGSPSHHPTTALQMGQLKLVFGVQGPAPMGPGRSSWSDRLAESYFDQQVRRKTPSFIPTGGWNPIAKAAAATVIASVGKGDFEKGVLDRPEPPVPPVDFGAMEQRKFEIPQSATVWLPPDVYKTDAQREVSEAAARALESAVIQEDDEVSHDWGHLGRQVVGGWLGVGNGAAGGLGGGIVDYDLSTGFASQTPSRGASTATGGGGVPVISDASCEPCGPRYLTYDCKTGTFKPRRRRRRRRLLTPTDIADLAALAALAGKGAALQSAIAQAVRR